MKKSLNTILYIVLINVSSLGWSADSYNLDLIFHIDEITDYNSNSNFGVSDVWGYRDETGIEYAIVGYRYGTMIYDVSSSNVPIEISNITHLIGIFIKL